jgi:hypothetical protein
MVTETDEVSAALDRVRAVDPNGKVNLAELVVLGAGAKVEQLQRTRAHDDSRAALRESFLDRTRTGAGVDWDALTHVHEHGWAHRADG